MREVFSKNILCHCHWAYIANPDFDLDVDGWWKGQVNGICGTASPGQISFTFGPHTDYVNLRIFIADDRPELEDFWEEVIESPFLITENTEISVTSSDGDPYDQPIFFESGEYRVRLCAVNYGLSEDVNCNSGEKLIEKYELIIWKSILYPDEIIKVTSDKARYWHESFAKDKGGPTS
jgi:hypothetical protein